MRDRTIIPTNLLDWPRCSTLLPDQKLIIHWLWACPYFSCAGAGLLPINAAAATLGLDSQALAGGLKTLVAAELIEIDIATGEVAVCDWFRFHSFKSPIAKSSLTAAIKKIQALRFVVLHPGGSRCFLSVPV